MIIPHRCSLQSQKSRVDMVTMIKKKSEVSHINVSKFFLKNMLVFTHVLKMKKIIAVISNEPKACGVWFEYGGV